jgi:hypothetical protein
LIESEWAALEDREEVAAREPDGLMKAAANPRGMQGSASGR